MCCYHNQRMTSLDNISPIIRYISLQLGFSVFCCKVFCCACFCLLQKGVILHELILNFLDFSDQPYGRGSRSESFDNRFLANPVLLAKVLNSAPGPACIRLLQKVQYCISVRTNVRQPETLIVPAN